MIKIIAFDIDGVLTDGTVIIEENSSQKKVFRMRDFDSLNELKRKGFRIAVITGEDNRLTDYLKDKIEWDYYRTDCKTKEKALVEMCDFFSIPVDEACYVGDGLYDIGAIKRAGLGLCPSDASLEAKDAADIVLHNKGGHGIAEEVLGLVQRIAERYEPDLNRIKSIESLVDKYDELKDIQEQILSALDIMIECYSKNNKIIVAGNGGSASDSAHIVGELMKSFRVNRTLHRDFESSLIAIDGERGRKLADKLQEPLRAISLAQNTALSTAILNDMDSDMIFAQEIFGYGDEGDVFIAITTSGNSENIINASVVAKAKGLKVIALTGNSGGEIAKLADCSVVVPEDETYLIQELHLPIYHWWCCALEEYFFGKTI